MVGQRGSLLPSAQHHHVHFNALSIMTEQGSNLSFVMERNAILAPFFFLSSWNSLYLLLLIALSTFKGVRERLCATDVNSTYTLMESNLKDTDSELHRVTRTTGF